MMSLVLLWAWSSGRSASSLWSTGQDMVSGHVLPRFRQFTRLLGEVAQRLRQLDRIRGHSARRFRQLKRLPYLVRLHFKYDL